MAQGPIAVNPAVKSGVSVPLQLDPNSGNQLVINASDSKLNLSAATVVKATPGMVGTITVTTAGAAGTISDCATTGAVAAANLIAVVPATVGPLVLNFPCKVGIVYTPGAAQVASISFR